MAIASSARLFSRRLSRIRLSSSSSNSILSSSPSSADEALVLSRHLSSASLATRRFDHAARFEILPFNRIFSTSDSEEQKPDLAREELVPKAPIKPPPRPFKLNNEHRELAAEIGYNVVDRYTEEDFGHNKRPKSFAIVQIGSHQFKVSPNDLIYTEKLKYCDINDKLMLSKVLLLGSNDQTIIGRPTVPKTAVFAVVEEHALDEKVIIFKKKRRKTYHWSSSGTDPA